MVPNLKELSPKLKNTNRATYQKLNLEIIGASKLNETTNKGTLIE